MSTNVLEFPGATGTAAPRANQPPATLDWRSRDRVQEDIDRHIAARDAYGRAVAWEAAAESQKLPPCQIEDARARTATAYNEMQSRARMLVICMSTDTRGLVDLLLYLEQNWTILPDEMHKKSVAFELLRSMRLSLRGVLKESKS